LWSIRAPLGGERGTFQKGNSEEWSDVDMMREWKSFASQNAWMTAPLRRTVQTTVERGWSSLKHSKKKQKQQKQQKEHHHRCHKCAPNMPTSTFAATTTTQYGKNGTVKSIKSKIDVMENPLEASQYEQALKERPLPMVVQKRTEKAHTKTDNEMMRVRVVVNPSSLVHQAASSLQIFDTDLPQPLHLTTEWRLVEHTCSGKDVETHPLTMLTTIGLKELDAKVNVEGMQPPSFAQGAEGPMTLWHSQVPSFQWMLERENGCDDALYVQTEVREAWLDALGIRLEGRATQSIPVRGGIIGDGVGFGKTALALAIIDANPKDETGQRRDRKRRLYLCNGQAG
jgi:hypothetical protein